VFKSERFIVIRVDNLVLVNVYMPCQSSDNNYEDVYAETLANIINVTLDLHNCSFIIAGDFNCNMNVSHSMFSIIDEFMLSLGLVNVMEVHSAHFLSVDHWCLLIY